MKRLYFICFILIVFQACNSLTGNTNLKKRTINKSTRTYHGGEIKYVDDIPVLKLKGTYYEMGLQYGHLLKDEINYMMKRYNKMKTEFVISFPWYKKIFTEPYIFFMNRKIQKRIPKEYLEELRGICDGSGVKYRDLLFSSFSGNMLDAGCTSLVYNFEDSMIHARNFDMVPYFLGENVAIVEYNPKGKNKVVNFGVIAYTGMFNAINDDGISATLNYGNGSYSKKSKGIPIGYKIRYLLENLNNFDEIDNYLKNNETDEPGSILTILSEKEKRAAIFDICDGTVLSKEIEDEKYLLALNQIFSKNRYNRPDLTKKQLTMYYGLGNPNVTRKITAEKYLLENKIESIDDMLIFLSNTDYYKYKNFIGTGSFATIANEYTLFTLIFDNKNSNVYFGHAGSYSPFSNIYKYDLNTGNLNLYRDKIKNDEVNRFVKWFKNYQELYLKKDEDMIIKNTDITKEPSIKEIVSVYRSWKKDRKAIDYNEILNAINKYEDKYNNYYITHLLKGRIYQKEKKYDEAIIEYTKAIDSEIIFENNKFYLNLWISECYKEKKEIEKELIYSKISIEIIEKYKKDYKLDKTIEKDYKKLLKKYKN